MLGGRIRSQQVIVVISALIFLWACSGPAGYWRRVLRGIPFAVDYVLGMWPPDTSILPFLVDPLIETIQMGIVATVLSTVISVPLSFLAARETSPNIVLYAAGRSLINFLRAMPSLAWAILFVAMVGLGPLAGIFALTCHCVGALGKYFSEAIEAIITTQATKECLEAMRVDGANEWQVLYYGLLPAVMPIFLSYIFTYFEWSIRVGTIMGLVGAGGIGLYLSQTIGLFRRQQTATIILLILGTVMVIDRASRIVRSRFL